VKATQRNQWVQRQQHLQARLTNTTGTATTRPLLSALPISYEIAERECEWGHFLTLHMERMTK
jgi:hypothetical protein